MAELGGVATVLAGMMVSLDIVTMLWALGFFYWRAALDQDIAARAPVTTGGRAGI